LKWTTSANPWLNLLIPRPQLGATLDFGGKTSAAYAGFSWQIPLCHGFFI